MWSALLFKADAQTQAPLISATLTRESLSHVQKYFRVNIQTDSFWAVSDEAVQTRAIPKHTHLLEIATPPKDPAEQAGATVSWKQH